jgi:hypothetical protein
MRRRVYVAAAGVLTVLVVGACSHEEGGKSSGGANAAAAGRSALRPNTGYGADNSLRGSVAGPARGTGTSGELSAGGSAGVPQSNTAGSTQLTQAAKIRVAGLTVAIKGAANVAKQADAADAIALAAGGDVDADDRTSGRHATASLLLRVPPAALQPTLRQLAKLGDERYRKLSTTDVTQEVADVGSRIASAHDSIKRLRVLYASAQKVRDVIQIENELNTREAALESLQARQRSLSLETADATINLSLVTAAKKKAVAVHHKQAKQHGGFIGGLDRGWDGFVAAAVWIASAVGTVLPFVALLVILALAARRFGWAIPRHRPSPAPTPSE